jgi:hypothetical protein
VHLSRNYYQYDFETGQKNPALKPKVTSLFWNLL